MNGSCQIDVGWTQRTHWDEKNTMGDRPRAPRAILGEKTSGTDQTEFGPTKLQFGQTKLSLVPTKLQSGPMQMHHAVKESCEIDVQGTKQTHWDERITMESCSRAPLANMNEKKLGPNQTSVWSDQTSVWSNQTSVWFEPN